MLQQRKLKKHWLMMWKVLIQESWSMLKRRRRILYRINLVSSTTFLQNLRITYSNDLSCFQNYNFYILQLFLWSEPDLLSLSWDWATLKNCDSSHSILRPPTLFPLYLRAYETHQLVLFPPCSIYLLILYSISLVDIVDYKILC